VSLDVVFFELRGRRCAVAVGSVREVLPMPSVTPVPLAPSSLRGVAPVHGQVLPVIDLGGHVTPSGEPRLEAPLFRATSEKLLVVEAALAGEASTVRAALAVDRVLRLGTVDEGHARPAPAALPFVSATVLDVEGPALLIDADRALEHVRASFATGARS
jgi:chemotaxis signal transduction protein